MPAQAAWPLVPRPGLSCGGTKRSGNSGMAGHVEGRPHTGDDLRQEAALPPPARRGRQQHTYGQALSSPQVKKGLGTEQSIPVSPQNRQQGGEMRSGGATHAVSLAFLEVSGPWAGRSPGALWVTEVHNPHTRSQLEPGVVTLPAPPQAPAPSLPTVTQATELHSGWWLGLGSRSRGLQTGHPELGLHLQPPHWALTKPRGPGSPGPLLERSPSLDRCPPLTLLGQSVHGPRGSLASLSRPPPMECEPRIPDFGQVQKGGSGALGGAALTFCRASW